MRRILTAILIAVLAMPAIADETQHYWVFGDSLTSTPDSWANQLDDLGFATINNAAQPGLRLVDLTLPRYLNCVHSEVIIWIGTNDAGNKIPKKRYEQALTDAMQFFEGRECKVWLILPLQLDTLGSELQERTLAAREWTLQIASMYSNVSILDPHYSPDQTVDGLHPNTGAQFWTAVYLLNEIGMTAPKGNEDEQMSAD